MMPEIEVEEIIVETRQSQIDVLINRLMRGEKHLSYSAMKAFKESPLDFIQYSFREKVTTDAMLFGTVVHCLVLEPKEFDLRFAVLDDIEICNDIGGAKPRATNAYKQWKQSFQDQNTGKTVITYQMNAHAKLISDNIKSNRASAKVLALCKEREKPVEWDYKNFKFHGFIDGNGETAVFDLKTCADANPRNFQRDIIKMSYYLQAAMYLTAIGKTLPYYLIAADKKGGVSVHRLDASLINYGLAEYEKLLDNFNGCMLKENFGQSYDFWAEMSDGIYQAEKPAYLY